MRSVIPNSFRNRKIEVDGLGFCSRKRDFQALATLWETRHFSQNQRFWKKQSNKFRVTKMRSVIPNLFRNRKIEVDGLNLLPEVYIQNLISSQWRKKRTDLAFVRFLFAEFLMYLKKQGICLCSDYGGGLKSFEKPEFPVGCPGESERKRQIPCFFRFSLGLSCILQKYFDCCHQARRIGTIFCYYVVGCAVGR